MPAQASNLETRISTLTAVLTEKDQQSTVANELKTTKGDWPTALANLKGKLPPDSLKKIELAHSLAVWADDNTQVVKALVEKPEITNLRDVALHFNAEKLAALVKPKTIPETIAGATPDEKKKNFAIDLEHKLFIAEPTAMLQRMVAEAEVPTANAQVRTGITSFLNNQPNFNIRTTSVYTALKQPEAFKDIPKEQRADVVEQLKTLQRVQAISPVPEAIPALIKSNLTSAFQVAEMPESTFLNTYGKVLGEGTAQQVYTNAINSHIRNEHALVTMRETLRGTGLAILDGKESLETRITRLQEVADEKAAPINLDTLFNDMDYCVCDECQSVYSPASYFVELLQYLRNNNLDPDPKYPNTGKPGIADTPVEKLFRRRPDLGCLELTCENTFTVLPYIDLVNEVMESFVVHLDAYHNDTNTPRQATLDAFNVDNETSSELLAQPQRINYQAYCILKHAVYPFTLPYHQPIDAIRILLNYLGTSRYELLDTYRTAHETCVKIALTPDEQKELETLHQTVLDRAVNAEFLGLTQEEYIILTKEAFWPKRYFEITLKKSIEDKDYRANIGVQEVYEYYGYTTKDKDDMLSLDEAGQKGLTFVKKQFLPRTGIQYPDLVELLKTRFINPKYPQGQALVILESIRFSYRFLQALVDTSKPDKFAKLIQFLQDSLALFPGLEILKSLLHPEADPCKQQPHHCAEISSQDLQNWVYCYFERIGQLIVLESGEGPQLPIEGEIFAPGNDNNPQPFGKLRRDGTILDVKGAIIGHVAVTIGTYNGGQVVTSDGNVIGHLYDSDLADNTIVPVAGPISWIEPNPIPNILGIEDSNNKLLGLIRDANSLGKILFKLAKNGDGYDVALWSPAKDTCNLEKVRLTHLDGTPLTAPEYDCIHRFIRLWRKMGWSIDETDKALVGIASSPSAGSGDGGTPGSGTPEKCDYINFDAFKDDCPPESNGGDGGCDNGDGPGNGMDCPEFPQFSCDILPAFLHQLVAIRKLLDLTGLPLIKLLTFWTDISTVGEKSLYTQLFLTHNLLGIDKVFKPDANGNYLTQTAKITDHLPVIMAALNLKADDITAIMSFRQLSNALTLPNVSTLYRHSLLAKILHVRMVDLFEVIALFGDPFTSAWSTVALLETWGKMEDAGFTFQQLNYLIRDHDDPLRPLAPSKKTILQLTKSLYDGLSAIDHDHPDVPEDKKDEATADLVRTQAGLLFEQSVVAEILGLLEGTTIYTTNAPANLTLTIPDDLANKLKYNNQKEATPPTASIQVTGILTKGEEDKAKGLSSNNLDWANAIDRVRKQASNLFNDAHVLSAIFAKNKDDGIKNLLAGDVNVPPDPKNPAATDANTAPAKRFYFLKYFLTFLRQQLAQRFITKLYQERLVFQLK
jgi:hypothetical protein